MSSIVAIVGRPNVWKSTFFNRLIQKRDAIVDSQSGVTRDRHYGYSFWNGKEFTVIDTGGFMLGGEDNFEKEINSQVMIAIEEADIVVFVVDVETGVSSMDYEISRLLHKSSKEVVLAVNKVDNSKRQLDSIEFHSLGFDKTFNFSAINGSGTGEVLDCLASLMPDESVIENDEIPGFAVVGRPNAGKSSFINALLGEERYVVKDLAVTTRDSIDTHFNRFGFDFKLIDTAGIRKKSKISDDVEFYSVVRSIRTIENSDVCLIIFDFFLIPAVSINLKSKPNRLKCVSMLSRVVPAKSFTTYRSSPSNALINDDLPALGLPTTAKPGISSFSMTD